MTANQHLAPRKGPPAGDLSRLMVGPGAAPELGAVMCLGIPGRITEVWDEDGAPMAHADFAGQVRRVCLAYLPDLTVGDFVITHMGYALTRLTEQDAAVTLATMREYGVLDPLDPPATPTTGYVRGTVAAVPGRSPGEEAAMGIVEGPPMLLGRNSP